MTLLLPVLGLMLLSGLTLAGALIVSRRARRILEYRVALVSGEANDDIDPNPHETHPKAPEQLGTNVRRVFSFGISRNWGMRASGLKLLLISAATAALAWLAFRVGLHFSNWLALLLAALAAYIIPRKLIQREQSKTELQFMDFFPNAIDMVVRMLRVGMPVTAAIRSVGQEAPSPTNAVFTSLADQVEIGIPFEDALNNAGERIGLTDFRFFAVAISLQRTSGGNLVTTLETLSDIIRKRRATRMKAKSATAEVRMSTYILAAIPFLVIGGMALLSPAYLAPLIVDPRGNVIVGIAIGMLLMGFLTMRWMMRSATRM